VYRKKKKKKVDKNVISTGEVERTRSLGANTEPHVHRPELGKNALKRSGGFE